LGLQHFLEISKNEALNGEIIEGMKKHADVFMEDLHASGKALYLCSRHWLGINSVSILEPIVRLYNITKEPRYLEFAAEIVNGGGAEGFLDEPLASLPDLPTVDTSAGVALLESCHTHDHPHGGEPTDEHAHAANEHLWVSPTRYAAQVAAATEALCALDPENAAAYAANGEAYRQRVLAVGERLRAAADKLPSKTCIIFHDSLAYLADELGLTVAASLHVGEESGVSAADLAAAQRAATTYPNVILLYDSQYTIHYPTIDALVPAAHVLTVDTAVIGRGHASDWLDAMEGNAELFVNITEGEL
jgi:zinc transport system substrate-binding protein